ncbi:transposase [Streptomyces sp. NBC_01233]|uniref:transposase n=1 Tax=Streptomyces sp. NBC_01233 TaxID=2903787 RepID=UPI002E0F61A6|nr:transposase [Streptomyces sp. NBC_01233]
MLDGHPALTGCVGGSVSARAGRWNGARGSSTRSRVRAAASVPAASRGYDDGKKVPGRERLVITDTLGLLLVVAVTAANVGDRDAAVPLGRRRRHRRPRQLGEGENRAHPGRRQTHRRHGGVRGAAPPLGGKAHLRMDRTGRAAA